MIELDQLVDIVEPLTVSWWPLSVSQIGLLVLLIGNLVFWITRRIGVIRTQAYKREAKKLIDQAESKVAVSHVLKRVAFVAYSRESVAGLYDEAWVNFLNRCSRKTLFDVQDFDSTNNEPLNCLKKKAKDWVVQFKPSRFDGGGHA